jgi:hypothetical protein
MLFFLDENVANTVAIVLRKAGHEAVFIRDMIPAGSVDQLVAALAENEDAVLVSHDKDFKTIAPRIPDGQRRRFKKLSQLKLACAEPKAAERVEQNFPFIDLESQMAKKRHDKRVMIQIGKGVVTIFR